MTDLNILLLSKWEEKLLKGLSLSGDRPKDLIKKTKIPNASAYLAFNKLELRGLSKKHVIKSKTYWFLNTSEYLGKSIHGLEKALGLSSKEKINMDNNSGITVHRGKDQVSAVIKNLTSLPSASRVTIFQGVHNAKTFFNTISVKDTIDINKKLSSGNILFESIIPENYFEKLIPIFGKNWALSYADRPNNAFMFPSEFDYSNATTFMYGDEIYIVDFSKQIVVEIKSKSVVLLIKSMVDIIKSSIDRTDIWKKVQ